MTTRLYALGSNSSGQLGIGHQDDVQLPTACQFISHPASDAGVRSSHKSIEGVSFRNSCELRSPIRKIVAGGNHTIILCDDGAVYAAGNREALGEVVDLATQSDGSGTPAPAPYFKRVMWWQDSQLVDVFTDISATWSASFFVVAPRVRNNYVVRYGKIYVCGKGDKGELGLGEDVVETTRPRLVALFGPKYSSGSMGNDARENTFIPGILAGIWSSVAYTVTCSSQMITIFGWGSCRKGQLGESVRSEKVLWRPTKVAAEEVKPDSGTERTHTAAAGKDFVLLQGIERKHENWVSRWQMLGGSNFFKGDGDDVKELLAELSCSLPRTVSAFASWSNVYLLDHGTQQVKALGRNDHGQLPPAELPRLRTMAAGSEHCAAITIRGQVVAWGWGEHGNCGGKCNETGHGWSVLNLPLAGGEKVAGVGAGCATTFIWTAESQEMLADS